MTKSAPNGTKLLPFESSCCKESNGINFVSFGAFFALDQKSALGVKTG